MFFVFSVASVAFRSPLHIKRRKAFGVGVGAWVPAALTGAQGHRLRTPGSLCVRGRPLVFLCSSQCWQRYSWAAWPS